MPDNPSLRAANDSAVIHQISLCVYQAIISIQQYEPELLSEKYRNAPWSDTRYQSAFLLKLEAELSKAQDRDTLIKTVQKFLQVLLIGRCLELPIYSNLLAKIRHMSQSPNNSVMQQAAGANSTNVQDTPNASSADAHTPKAIAILLLDTENLQLDTKTENFLTTVCTYPIQVKIAFANWRHLGKLDAELHERGYDLIHVPAGRDNADGKMIAVGLSIREHYPKAREVLVCSSDKVMTNLCNHLLKTGLNVYRVWRQGENLTISNYKNGKTETYPPKKLPEIPTLVQCITHLQLLIKTEQERTGNQWIKLSRISALFLELHQITISQVVAAHLPGKRARDIFINNPSDFVVHQPPEQSELYVTLFETIAPRSVASNNSNNSAFPTDVRTDIKPLHTINSKEELEQALIGVFGSIKTKSPESKISLSHLGTGFRTVYKKSATEVLKKLGLGSSLSKFLQSCQGLKVQNTGKDEFVELAQNSISTINSQVVLEQVLINLLNSLTNTSHNLPIPIESLGSEFHKQYGVTISAIMKQLKMDGNFLKFLQSCSAFKVENSGKSYRVAIAK
ncbi:MULTISPECIES: NYN domain-containing protein [Cyanophyceae]|uniref:NYN domain-containing protein n=1 Tax=Cyanophyceae TaxID=3028117 RepID=UPI0016895436|nr:NYN domain-containing protein [Trichocoleus sp. FACHB-69]MBD1932747.1 NYN domain-containing protein [Trichocoleus sp. FACHB-69]